MRRTESTNVPSFAGMILVFVLLITIERLRVEILPCGRVRQRAECLARIRKANRIDKSVVIRCKQIAQWIQALVARGISLVKEDTSINGIFLNGRLCRVNCFSCDAQTTPVMLSHLLGKTWLA